MSTLEFTYAEVRNLIQGKFDFRKCLECDGRGWVWVDGDIGETVAGPQETEDKQRYYRDCCDFCEGLGGYLKVDDR